MVRASLVLSGMAATALGSTTLMPEGGAPRRRMHEGDKKEITYLVKDIDAPAYFLKHLKTDYFQEDIIKDERQNFNILYNLLTPDTRSLKAVSEARPEIRGINGYDTQIHFGNSKGTIRTGVRDKTYRRIDESKKSWINLAKEMKGEDGDKDKENDKFLNYQIPHGLFEIKPVYGWKQMRVKLHNQRKKRNMNNVSLYVMNKQYETKYKLHDHEYKIYKSQFDEETKYITNNNADGGIVTSSCALFNGGSRAGDRLVTNEFINKSDCTNRKDRKDIEEKSALELLYQYMLHFIEMSDNNVSVSPGALKSLMPSNGNLKSLKSSIPNKCTRKKIAIALQKTVAAVNHRSMFSKDGTNFINIVLANASEALLDNNNETCGEKTQIEQTTETKNSSLMIGSNTEIGLQEAMDQALKNTIKKDLLNISRGMDKQWREIVGNHSSDHEIHNIAGRYIKNIDKQFDSAPRLDGTKYTYESKQPARSYYKLQTEINKIAKDMAYKTLRDTKMFKRSFNEQENTSQDHDAQKKFSDMASEQFKKLQEKLSKNRESIKEATEQRLKIRTVMLDIFREEFDTFWTSAQKTKDNNDLNSKIGVTYSFQWALAKRIGQCIGKIDQDSERISPGKIVLIIILCLIAIFGVGFAIWYFGFRETIDNDLDTIDDEEE